MYRIIIRFFCLAVLLTVGFPTASCAEGPPPIELLDSDEFYQSVRDHALYLEDPTLDLEIHDVMTRKAQFSPIETPYIDFGIGPSRHWLWFAVANSSDRDGIWRVDLRIQFLREATVYAVRNGKDVTPLFRQTNADTFTSREIANRFLATDVAVASGETVQIFIGYRSTSPAYLPVAVGTRQGVVADQSAEDFVDAMFNGGLIVMMVIAIMLIPIAGWSVGLSFLGYIVATTLYVYQADGYAFMYFWPEHPEFHVVADLMIGLAMPATGLMFSRALFDTASNLGAWDRIILWTAILAAVLAITAPLYIENSVFLWSSQLVVLIGTGVQLITAIIVVRMGLVGARSFLLGISCVVFAIAYATIAHLQPGYWSLDRTLDVGHAAILAECFAFVGAIVERMIAIMDQRDIALRAELEEVQRRLKIETALRVAQADYARANSLSEARLNQMASVTHDIQSPLKTLRYIVDRFKNTEEAQTNSMHAALDYIENLAQLELRSDTTLIAPEAPEGAERFSNRVVLTNVAQLFAELAAQKGVLLRHIPNDIVVTANPVRLMRIVSNLVANTIEHSQAGKVLLLCRKRSGSPAVEVWDDGIGMSAEEITALRQQGRKGDHSDGSGMGLAIVEEECAIEGLKFEVCSRPGQGSCMRIVLDNTSHPQG